MSSIPSQGTYLDFHPPVPSLVGVCVLAATNRCFSLTLMLLSSSLKRKKKDVSFKRYKGFRSCVPGKRDEDQVHVSYYVAAINTVSLPHSLVQIPFLKFQFLL